jgi:hypothetical protein
MIIGIQGSKNFSDYTIFLRAMGTAMSQLPPEDKEILIYSAGPVNINTFVMEFSNVSERSLKARGIKIRFSKIPPSWIENNMSKIDHFLYFSKPKETLSPLVKLAEAKDIEVGIYRY